MKKTRRKATIYDIAKAAGISPSTVSLVLGGRWQGLRIREETAKRVLIAAEELGYSANLRARGLRLNRSGLGGMILPHYRNRFFAGLAEQFEIEARRRGLCPIVVSTQRDAGTELATARSLIAHQVEFLFVAGVHDPREINQLCADAGIRSVNIDLPGEGAPSAISDNRGAATEMTRILLQKFAGRAPVDFLFFGGNPGDNSTVERMAGVRDAFRAQGMALPEAVFQCSGYQPPRIAEALRTHLATRGGTMPNILFANGVTALEGLLQVTAGPGLDLLRGSVIGCYDWDPFAANLPLDITFVRQDVEALIGAGFHLLDTVEKGGNPTLRVPASIRRAPEPDP